ncbi:MAG: ABC transporter permease [Candidatus Kapaibacterium sp.]
MKINKLLMVARWEFTEKIRTKAFLVALFVTPLITMVFSVLPTLLATKESVETKSFAFYDGTGQLLKPAQELLNKKHKLSSGQPMYQLVPTTTDAKVEKIVEDYKKRVLNEEFTGIFVAPAGIEKDRKLTYYSPNVANLREIERVGSAIENVIIESQLKKNNVDIEKYREISKSVDTDLIKITKDGKNEESDFLKQFMGAYASLFLIIILITTTGQALVRSLLEEKNNRIMEVILSSCSAKELMFGKLLGLGGLGLVQGGVWGILGVGAATYFNTGFAIANLPIILLYAILGYLFYASLMIGIGSTATTEQEAQNITGYIIMLSVMPFMFIMALLENPNGTLAKVLSYIPFLTPSIMTFRISVQTPELWEILLSIVEMVIAISVVIYLSSKVFTVGILSYGKRLTLAEVWHLMKSRG